MISATLIADSISENGDRLTTLQLRYPRFIHAEFMTHRVFSRNASSSRAVPTSKLLEEVRSDELRAAPIFWGKNQKGMQAAEELTGEELEDAQRRWKAAALDAVWWAEHLASGGAHKQIVNRILEPFTHINVVVTATCWDNFFGLRCHKDAQPEMQALAHAMWDAMGDNPQPLKQGQWHLPYVDAIPVGTLADAIKVSVARCARVSYLSHETGKPSTIEEDLKLYDRLLGAQPFHASPAEHQATPDYRRWSHANQAYEYRNRPLWGNFYGWQQYRKTLPGESVAPITTNPKGSYNANANLHREAGQSS